MIRHYQQALCAMAVAFVLTLPFSACVDREAVHVEREAVRADIQAELKPVVEAVAAVASNVTSIKSTVGNVAGNVSQTTFDPSVLKWIVVGCVVIFPLLNYTLPKLLWHWTSRVRGGAPSPSQPALRSGPLLRPIPPYSASAAIDEAAGPETRA